MKLWQFKRKINSVYSVSLCESSMVNSCVGQHRDILGQGLGLHTPCSALHILKACKLTEGQHRPTPVDSKGEIN